MRLSTRLSAVASGALAFCFALLAAALLFLTSDSLHAYFETDIRYKSEQLKALVDAKLRSAKAAAGFFEASDALLGAVKTRDHAGIVSLGKLAMSSFGLEYFVVTDPKGTVLANAQETDASLGNLESEPEVQAAREGRSEAFLVEDGDGGFSVRGGAALKARDGSLIGTLSLGYELSGDAFVDSVKALFGCEATVFRKTTRVATTILKDGIRIVGTTQDDPAILDAVLGKGGDYFGEAKIQGDSYFVAYQPLLDAQGRPVGMLFLGNRATVIDKVLATILTGAAFALGLALLGVSLVILVSIRRAMRPLETMTATLAASENDLRLRFDASRADEVGATGKKLNEYFERMSVLVGNLKTASQKGAQIGFSLAESAEEVGAVVEEIGATIKNLDVQVAEVDRELEEARRSVHDIDANIASVAERLEEQGVAVQESSSSIEELVGSIENVNRTTQERRVLAEELSALAEQSEEDMGSTVDSIHHIEAAARSISELVDIIRSVASQTDLLAMNAAIEAAHAGQFGKGFSVVSDEIRKLAEATADSAELISRTIADVDLSIAKAQETALTAHSSLDRLVRGTKDMGGAMVEIGFGMGEMSAGSRQIVGALGDLVRITKDISEAGAAVRNRTVLALASIEAVAGGSGENRRAMGEIVGGLGEIITAMETLKGKGAENSEILSSLEAEMDRFKV